MNNEINKFTEPHQTYKILRWSNTTDTQSIREGHTKKKNFCFRINNYGRQTKLCIIFVFAEGLITLMYIFSRLCFYSVEFLEFIGVFTIGNNRSSFVEKYIFVSSMHRFDG